MTDDTCDTVTLAAGVEGFPGYKSVVVCERHGVHCPHVTPRPDWCDSCHLPWDLITAPATWVTQKTGLSKEGLPIITEEIHYLFGRGQTRDEHLAMHAKQVATEIARREKKAKT